MSPSVSLSVSPGDFRSTPPNQNRRSDALAGVSGRPFLRSPAAPRQRATALPGFQFIPFNTNPDQKYGCRYATTSELIISSFAFRSATATGSPRARPE